MKNFSWILVLILCITNVYAQRWVELMNDPSVDFYTVKQAFEQEWGNRPYERGKGWKQYKRWEYFMEDRVYPSGKRPRPAQAWEEHLKFKNKYERVPSAGSRAANWTALGPSNWNNTSGWNPGNGRINCVEQDPNNAAVLYAGSASGGLWKSINGGSNWTNLTDNLPVLGVSAILVDPTNSNVIYLGTGDGDGSDTYSIGVLKSTDGGQTWNTTGLSWSIANTKLIRRMIMHPSNNQIIFAATNDGIYRSTDGGNNWAQSQSGNMRDVEFKPGDPSVVYACSDQFYKSNNSGVSFAQVTTGLPIATAVNRASIAVTPANPNYVYILFGDEGDSGFYGLYRSVNSGTSFTLRSNTPNIFTYDELGADTGGQSWYDMALAVSPTNADLVFSGGINVWNSIDGGASWNCLTHWVHPATLGYVHADIHTLDFFGTNLYCGSDGGISKSTNFGIAWTNLSPGIEIMQLYRLGVSAQNAYRIIGGSQDNGTNLLVNGQWNHVLGADGMEAAIDYSNGQFMYGCIQNGALNASSDGGQNWTDIVPSIAVNGAWVTPYVIDPNVPSTLYAGYEEVWKTTDRGLTWNQVSSFGTGNTLNYIAVAKSNSNYIYAGRGSVLYKTINGGQNWSTVTPQISAAIKYITIDPLNENRIWIALSGFNATQKVFYSPDGGASWQNISGNLPNLPVNCIEYQAGSADGLYVGTDVGVYYKDNNLSNWQAYMTGLPNVIVNELEIHYGISKIRAATYGRGVWESDLFSPSPFAPSADFSYISGSLCAGDSIKFTDNSINAAPGWQWFFPGGNPSSATLQSPNISYQSAGTYPVTLIVSNLNGSDTIQQNVTVDYANNRLNIRIITDSYPEETRWQITDSLNNVVASGGPLSVVADTVNQLVCLRDGCYTFTINDAYGDGICCAYGDGSYAVIDSVGNILGQGGQFTNSESFLFCFNRTPPVTITAATSTQSGCGSNDGSIEVSALGGDGNYEYSIDGINFQVSNILQNLAPGSYIVYCRDGIGQTDTYNAAVTEIPGPTAVLSNSNPNVFLNTIARVNFSGILSVNAVAFAWDFGDGTTASTVTTSHTYTAAGTYTAVLSAIRDNCTDYDSVTVTVGLANGSNILNDERINMQVIPNPVSGQFMFNIDLPESEELFEIYIHNAVGQAVYWERAESPGKNIQRNLNFANEASGIYFLSIKSPNYRRYISFVKD